MINGLQMMLKVSDVLIKVKSFQTQIIKNWLLFGIVSTYEYAYFLDRKDLDDKAHVHHLMR